MSVLQKLYIFRGMDGSRTYRTLVLCSAFFVAFFSYGTLQAYGSLFIVTLDRFQETRSKTSWINSVLLGTSFGAGILSGYLTKRFSLTFVSGVGAVLLPLGFILSYFATSVIYLIISVGISSGVGISFSYVSAVVAVSRVVSEKYKTSALALQNVACGLPGIVLPYLLSFLTTKYNLVGTLLIYGGIVLNNIAVTLVFKGLGSRERIVTDDRISEGTCDSCEFSETVDDSKDCKKATSPNKSLERDLKQGKIDFQEIKTQKLTYILFLVAASLILPNVGGFQTIFQDVGVYEGFSKEQVLSLIAAFNVASTAGRFLPILFQKFSDNPFILPTIASLSGVIGQIVILMTSQYHFLLIGYSLIGIVDGGISTSLAVVVFKILGPNAQVLGFGILMTVLGITLTAIGPVFGAIYDETKSYTIVLSLSASMFGLGAMLSGACYVSYRTFPFYCRQQKATIKDINPTQI